MDQQQLRQWESRCVQEEPPWCTAACPLHVDVRAFTGHLREGRWQEGWQTLTRVLPLPGLLARICDAPCERACKRGEAGDPIRIGALERACAGIVRTAPKITPLPAKDKRIAIFGSHISSLTAAWDLAKKGYAITLFTIQERPAGTLLADHAGALTEEVVTEELTRLQDLGIRFETQTAMGSADFLAQTRDSFDALYLGLDSIDATAWPMSRNPDGTVKVAAMVQTTSDPKVFAGGRSPSTIMRAAQGRWAATSIVRALQNVSMTAGREREGKYETRLFTSLDGVVPLPSVPMKDPLDGYTADEAEDEASRCLNCQCLECVKVCPFLEKYGAYPRRYVREIYNNESMVMGKRSANRMINTCSLCGLCQTVCPEDFAMQQICLQTRRSMVEKDRMPPSAHEFALEDLAFSQGDDFFMVRHAPDKELSTHLFFPGCQLSASAPEQAVAVYAHLRQGLDTVGLMLGCCGAPAHWSGRRDQARQVMEEWRQQWQAMGEPMIIAACATCLQMFREYLPQLPIRSLWESIDGLGLPEISTSVQTDTLCIHDPCTTRQAPALQATVRRLADRLGVTISELPLSGAKAECCGYGGLMENVDPELARETIRRRGEQSRHDYLTYCAMCRDSLAGVGKRSVHLLDLIFPRAGTSDPAARPRPGWTRRRENRVWLKQHLLDSLWNEALSEAEAIATSPLVLSIAPDVQVRLDQRRILHEDVRTVIAHAEADGPKMHHPETGRYRACFRPRHVTFWVEYAPTPDGSGFEVFNAYCHRMQVR